MKHYFEVLQEAIPGITSRDLSVPLKEPGCHILDAIVIRDTLESHFGFEIPDMEWTKFNTIAEAIDYCEARERQAGQLQMEGAKMTIHRDHEIRMPQMANGALSENWLLKEMGDMHWEMLSRGLEQKSSEFTDNQGNRLYAAFVRINYAISPLNTFRENEQINLDGAISRFGNYAYYSTLKGACNGKSISGQLMTSFSARKANDNTQIASADPKNRVNHIDELDATPGFYTEHRKLKKGLIQTIFSGGHQFNITDNVLETIPHTINPHFEINGVGLLYFASYPLIADTVASAFMKSPMGMTDYDKQYHTSYRDVLYFANCNADDQVIVELNSVEREGENTLKMVASLYRKSDGKLMAKVLTVKEKHA